MTISEKNKANGGHDMLSIRATRERIEKNLSGITQAGLLMACADGEIVENELEVIARNIFALLQELGVELSEEEFGTRAQALVQELTGKKLAEQLKIVAAKISDSDVARLAVGVAATVMVSDNDLSEDKEAPVYLALAAALGFDEAAANDIYDEYLSEP